MKFLISAHLPNDFDPTAMDPEVGRKMHEINAEIEAAGAMVFACGVAPVSMAKTARPQPGGAIMVTDGPYLETKEHLGGLLIVEADSMEAALEWASKGALASGMAVEVRQLFFQEG